MSGEELTQSRWGSRTRFEFGEDKLEFSLRDFSGEVTSSVPYGNINLESRSTVRVNAARRYYYAIVVGGLLVTFVIGIAAPRHGVGYLPFIFAVFLYLVLRHFNLMTVTFTVLRPAGGGTPIRIIQDRKHDEVLKRIKAAWVARMRRLYLAVDSENDPKREAQKFKWLLDREVISEAEYHAAIAQLNLHPAPALIDTQQVVH